MYFIATDLWVTMIFDKDKDDINTQQATWDHVLPRYLCYLTYNFAYSVLQKAFFTCCSSIDAVSLQYYMKHDGPAQLMVCVSLFLLTMLTRSSAR